MNGTKVKDPVQRLEIMFNERTLLVSIGVGICLGMTLYTLILSLAVRLLWAYARSQWIP